MAHFIVDILKIYLASFGECLRFTIADTWRSFELNSVKLKMVAVPSAKRMTSFLIVFFSMAVLSLEGKGNRDKNKERKEDNRENEKDKVG